MLAQTNLYGPLPISEQLLLFSPLLALVVTMLAVVTCPLVGGRSPRIIATTTVLGVAAMLGLSLLVGGRVTHAGVSALAPTSAAGMLIADNLSVFFQLLLAVFLAGVLCLWWMGPGQTERNAVEFAVLLLGSALGMALMVSTSNLLMIVVAIETASLPSYAMVGFDKRDRFGAEASLKYMIFGAISAAIMIYGVSLLYGLVGTLNLADLARFTVDTFATDHNRLVLSLGLLCFLAGIAFKISAVPFHFWCPDAFQGARIEVTTWLSVVSKAAGLILMARIVIVFSSAVDHATAMPILAPIAWLLGMMAAVTATIGNFAAYKQTSVKRMLAYSSIAHAGYMLMAAAIFIHPSSGGATAGVTALIVYVVIYLVMNLGAFGVVALVVWATGSDHIENFTGLRRRAPLLAIPLVVCLVSLIGIPPFAGFMGKWWVLLALGRTGTLLGWVLIVIAVVNTLISVYFYMRLVVQMMLRDDNRPEFRSPVSGVALVNACAVMLVVLFLFFEPLKERAERFAGHLYQSKPTVAAAAPTPDTSVAALP